MHLTAPAQVILKLVFGAGSAPLTRPRLERVSGLLAAELNRALAELARCGLLDAQRLRLTMSGLALAVALGARPKSRARRSARRPASAISAISAPIALFSQREVPRAVA